MTVLAPTLLAFFIDRLIWQRQASSHAVAAYRDTLRMLINYAAAQTGVLPSPLDFEQLDAPTIGAFLDHLEHERGNSVHTRNARLAAIQSLFHFAALLHSEHAASISRVLAIPPKRCDQALITYLADQEITALLAAPDPDTWTGRRDRALLLVAIQAGLRISELTGLTIADSQRVWPVNHERPASSAAPDWVVSTRPVVPGRDGGEWRLSAAGPRLEQPRPA
jgi:integrase/recombinase XerD